jgi:thiol-disulfide isomerase/thioredoxin
MFLLLSGSDRLSIIPTGILEDTVVSLNRRVFISSFPLVPSIARLAAAPKEVSKADLNLKDLNGQKVRLRDFRGKAVVLNFWATWCGPCKAELPMLVEAEKQYKERGVVFIAASLDDEKTKKLVPNFVSQHGVDFAVWLGAGPDDLDKLGMGEAVPATAFIDSEGRVVARVLGQIRKEELKDRLEWLAGGQNGAAPDPLVKHL